MRGISYCIVRSLPAIDAVTIAVLLAGVGGAALRGASPFTIALVLLVVPVTQAFLARSGVYDSHRVEAAHEIVRHVLLAHLAAAALFLPATYWLAGRSVMTDLALALSLSFAVLSVAKAAVHQLLQILRRRGFDRRNVLFVGLWRQANSFAEETQMHPEWGLHLDCVATGAPGQRIFHAFPSGEHLGDSVEGILKARVVDEVLVNVGTDPLPDILREAKTFEQYGVMVRAVFEPEAGVPKSTRAETFNGSTALALPSPRTERDFALKRAFDIVFATLLFLATAPLMALIAVLIKLNSPGPLLFVQTRVGLNGRRFSMLKFRTMVDGAEFLVRQADRSINRGPIYKNPSDYRITSVGRVLRKFSLDELPQLINVIRGEMSLVGPRPLPVYEAEKIEGEYRRRFSVPPGLTCIWQISGRSDVSYESWMRYDLQYVDRWSLWSDTVLILRTIPAVILGRGGY